MALPFHQGGFLALGEMVFRRLHLGEIMKSRRHMDIWENPGIGLDWSPDGYTLRLMTKKQIINFHVNPSWFTYLAEFIWRVVRHERLKLDNLEKAARGKNEKAL